MHKQTCLKNTILHITNDDNRYTHYSVNDVVLFPRFLFSKLLVKSWMNFHKIMERVDLGKHLHLLWWRIAIWLHEFVVSRLAGLGSACWLILISCGRCRRRCVTRETSMTSTEMSCMSTWYVLHVMRSCFHLRRSKAKSSRHKYTQTDRQTDRRTAHCT